MNKEARRFWSQRTRQLTPYIPGEQPKEPVLVKLNTNESPYSPSPEVKAVINQYPVEQLRFYPDPENTQLRACLAARYTLEPAQIFVGNGSDEILAFAFMAFFNCRSSQQSMHPGKIEEISFFDITYSFYPVYAKLLDIPYRQIPLDDHFRIDLNRIPRAGAGLILANPNAPTGRAISLAQIESILEMNRDRLVLVDEAYIDFGGESALPLIRDYDNLLVVQTFSKSRSLAGLRVGYAMGSEALIEALQRVRDSINSYTLDRLAQAAAVAAVRSEEWFRSCCDKIISTREQVTAFLSQQGFLVLPSSANFVFISHASLPAEHIFACLRKKGILVRHFKQERIENFLRVSIGSNEEMNVFMQAVAEIVNG